MSAIRTSAVVTAGGFGRGAASLLRGGLLILKNPRLWPLAAAPSLIAVLAIFLGAFAGVSIVGAMDTRWLHEWRGFFFGTLRWIVLVPAYVAAVIAAIVAAKVVVLPLAAGPFNAFLSEGVEAVSTGRAPPGRTFREALAALGPSLARALVTTAFSLGILVVSLPLLLIPVVGFFLYLVPSAYVEALGALDVTFARRALGLGAKRRWIREHRAEALGLGAAVLLGNVVPLGQIFVVPSAAAAGTLLIVEGAA